MVDPPETFCAALSVAHLVPPLAVVFFLAVYVALARTNIMKKAQQRPSVMSPAAALCVAYFYSWIPVQKSFLVAISLYRTEIEVLVLQSSDAKCYSKPGHFSLSIMFTLNHT